MKKFLRISALLTAALMVFIMVGCGGEEEGEKDTTPPTLASSNPANGGTMAANGSLTLVFSENMKEVTVNGTPATGSGKNWTWQATGLAAGAATLKVNGSDMAGNKLAEVAISVTVTAPDTTPPDIDGNACDPKAGADGVDPAAVSKIKIAFTEDMGEAKVDAFEPADAKIDYKLADAKTLEISFLGGYRLGNEMTVKVTLSGKDKAGNALKTTSYTFTTMKKEG